jgi:hypothetical protein
MGWRLDGVIPLPCGAVSPVLGVAADTIEELLDCRGDKFGPLATVILGSGLLFVAMFLAGAAALGGLAAGARFGTAAPLDAAVVGYARSLGYTFLLVFATKAAGLFTIVTSTMLLRLAHWPRWTGYSGHVAALVLVFSITFYEPVILLFPAWVTAMSGYVLFVGGGSNGVSTDRVE